MSDFETKTGKGVVPTAQHFPCLGCGRNCGPQPEEERTNLCRSCLQASADKFNVPYEFASVALTAQKNLGWYVERAPKGFSEISPVVQVRIMLIGLKVPVRDKTDAETAWGAALEKHFASVWDWRKIAGNIVKKAALEAWA